MHDIKKKIIKGMIISNRLIAPDHYEMEIAAPWLGETARPGQFVNVRLTEGTTDPLLRVPLGVYRITAEGIGVLYKVVGPGTRILSEKREKGMIDVLGPLGRGFDALGEHAGKEVLLVAGGHGIAPLHALAEELKRAKRKQVLFIGARTAGHVVCDAKMKTLCVDVYVTTEDGTRGETGYVTDAVDKYIGQHSGDKKRALLICACGPKPMLAAVSAMAEKHGVAAQVSLDEYMACGIGACKGCAVPTTDGMKMACTDGPVFDAKAVKWS